ncbi:cyclodeaminase/cyclohydrolase family protein [Clostridium sp. Marseille-Q2269]|uniref:cyclodeaminase/cyclohydrolase family protein n=1 Tax=Clostridium sp. Marseille-Q2269 TaxID=2942205 RepID=UPI0020738D38|nr:cyclodeaminase/cyclohydrolase family protein [Clostridium sp. Marseille-Q2269]
MLDKSCKEFVDMLSSKGAVPGGGGACAYVGALGMALGNMVANLTIGKKKYKDVEDEVREILKQGEILIEKLESLVNKDAEAFYPLSKAYGLPKNTEEERKYKDEVMEKALYEASLVPLQVAKCAAETIDLHYKLAKIGTRIAISDVGVGVLFCKTALEASKLNVYINTNMMKNNDAKNSLEEEISTLVSKYSTKADKVYSYIENLIRGNE